MKLLSVFHELYENILCSFAVDVLMILVELSKVQSINFQHLVELPFTCLIVYILLNLTVYVSIKNVIASLNSLKVLIFHGF